MKTEPYDWESEDAFAPDPPPAKPRGWWSGDDPRYIFSGDAVRKHIRDFSDVEKMRALAFVDREMDWGESLVNNPFFAPDYDAGGGYKVTGGIEGGWYVTTPEGALTTQYGRRQDAVDAVERLADGVPGSPTAGHR